MQLNELKHCLTPSDVKKIEETFFQLHSPNSLVGSAVAKVVTPDTCDEDGFPIAMGLMDPRLGVIGKNLECKTCGKNSEDADCEGHFGYIELAAKVSHPDYFKKVKQFFRMYCIECGSPLIGAESLERYNQLLLSKVDVGERTKVIDQVLRLSKKVKICPYCKNTIGRIKLKKPLTSLNDYEKIIPGDIEYFFEKVQKEEYFNFDESKKLEWMVLSVIPVAPVPMRPYYFDKNERRVDDGLTVKYKELVKVNQRLGELKVSAAPKLLIENEWEQLQKKVDQLFRGLHYRVDKSKEQFASVLWPSSVLNGLISRRSEVRGLAAIISGYVEFAEKDLIIDMLIKTAWDEDANVQIAVIRSLSYLKSKKAFSPLKQLLSQVRDMNVHSELLHYFNTSDEDITIPLVVSDNDYKNASLEVLEKVKSMSEEEFHQILKQMKKEQYTGVSNDVIYEKLFHHLLFHKQKEMRIERINQDISSNNEKMNRLTDLFIENKIIDMDYIEMMEMLIEENRSKEGKLDHN